MGREYTRGGDNQPSSLAGFRGIPHSEDMKVIEKFTRVDEETILYDFTIDDPRTYTESWGGEIPFKKFMTCYTSILAMKETMHFSCIEWCAL
ncbi:MAG: hypothetical protein CM1200mP14_25140 [Gammaproteobacteria bacterium]|nr:MAG: hypothetical protein CM1200mP14_25140 [Gammaproteobacteria bacterium]